MKDLTQGPVRSHLLSMAFPIAAGMIFQTLYYLVDLYFVAQLGDSAIAGVSVAGNVAFVVLALTQMLGVGTVALVSHAAGRKDRAEANLIFNQAVLLSALCGVAALIAGYALTGPYVRSVAADEATVEAAITYLRWFIPGLALQFALVALGSALRGTGIVKPTMIIQVVTVILNVVLAPVLIAGWGTGHPLGVAGAGLASSLSIAAGVVLIWIYFAKLEKYVAFHPEQFMPRFDYWRRILGIGLPAGGELGLIFVFTGVIYWVIADFGAAAQAGFGVGSRVMQAILLPAMAIAFAVAPVAGQNFGAGNPSRVRETFRSALIMGVMLMGVLTVVCQTRPEVLIGIFTNEADVIETGATFIRVISLSFIPQVVTFTCSSLFQSLGNTWPSLFSSISRLMTFAIPAVWLSGLPQFELADLWHLSVCTHLLQMVISLLLLRWQFRKRLTTLAEPLEVV